MPAATPLSSRPNAPPVAAARIAIACALIALASCSTRFPAPVEERSPRASSPAAAPAPPASRPSADAESRPQTYTVKRGDTLHAIALDHGLDYRELAAWNGIADANRILVGQVLRVVPPSEPQAAATTGVQTMPLKSAPPVVGSGAAPPATPAPAAPAGTRNTESYKTQPKALKEPYSEQALRDVQRGQAAATPDTAPPPAAPPLASPPAPPPVVVPPAPPASAPVPEPKPNAPADDENERLDWTWPAKGRVVAGFSEAASLKGIDIAGTAGQPVTASAAGKVVYVGTGLRGYGKLIIVKHNATYLSAYAHNRDIVAKEGQQVSKGQKIAEMGNTDADQVKLHFEIRRQGKPVDPLRYLPPQ